MKLIRKALVLGAAVATASLIACSSGPRGGTGSTEPTPVGTQTSGTGSVGFQYTIPGGQHISTITYTLSNTTVTPAYSLTKSVNVGSSSNINFVIGGVPAGTGYTISITGTTDDGLDTCSGSFGTGLSDAGIQNGAPFGVSSRSTTSINVNLICVDNANLVQGNVTVNAQGLCCAYWDTITANPSMLLTTAPGNVAQLAGNASGPCDGDAGAGVNLSCTWTILSGGGTVGATTTDGKGNFLSTYTCPTTGTNAVLQMACNDGPLPDGGACPAAYEIGTTTVQCGSIPCQNPTVGTGIAASPANSPTGTCAAPSINTGTLQDSSGNYCCSPGPCQGVGTGIEASPNSAAGSCPAGSGNTGLKDGSGNFCCAPLAPCTTSTAGCVQCQGNSSGLCSPTEAQFVQHDIKSTTVAGPDSTGCYACLLGAGCLDDTTFGDTGHECEDAISQFGTSAQCEATISCILSSSCATSGLSTCYCGTAGLSTTCQGNPAPGPINGACDNQFATGNNFPVTDGTDNVKALTNTARAGGRAGQIFQCAIANACSACLQ